jgi:N-carbamoylputrescine amidase
MPRLVRIAACSVEYTPGVTSRPRALKLVEQAGEMGADIVCLPEFSCAPVTDSKFAAEPVPGPGTDAFASLAAKHKMYLIVPLLEKADGGKHYNSAVVIDRSGKIVGRYHKTHLCLPNFNEGECTLPGQEIPVFKTDFGTIGITTCMDIHYPELYTTLALKGAEIIFWPSAAMDYTGDLIESLVNARAIDNQVYFVASHFVQTPYLAGKHYGRSRIIDPMGRIRGDTGHFEGVAIAQVDLDQTYPMWYQGKMFEEYPTMRKTIFNTRRPELYGEIVQPRREV